MDPLIARPAYCGAKRTAAPSRSRCRSGCFPEPARHAMPTSSPSGALRHWFWPAAERESVHAQTFGANGELPLGNLGSSRA